MSLIKSQIYLRFKLLILLFFAFFFTIAHFFSSKEKDGHFWFYFGRVLFMPDRSLNLKNLQLLW